MNQEGRERRNWFQILANLYTCAETCCAGQRYLIDVVPGGDDIDLCLLNEPMDGGEDTEFLCRAPGQSVRATNDDVPISDVVAVIGDAWSFCGLEATTGHLQVREGLERASGRKRLWPKGKEATETELESSTESSAFAPHRCGGKGPRPPPPPLSHIGIGSNPDAVLSYFQGPDATCPIQREQDGIIIQTLTISDSRHQLNT